MGAGICCSEFGGNPVPLVGNTTWYNNMKALAPGVVRASIAWYGGNPGYGAGGSSRTPGTATALINAIKSIGAVPLVSYNGDSSDNGGLTAANGAALVHYFNDGGGQHGGPVKYFSIGNEPEVSGPTPAFASIGAAMKAADPTANIGAPAAAYWDTGLLGTVTGQSWLGNLSWHEYDGANGDGSGFPADSNYAPRCATARGMVPGKLFGIEEANWDPTGGTTPNDWRNVCFIADIAGIILSAGGHLNVYGDWNGTLGILSDGSKGPVGTPMASYWGLGIHTGMNGQFKRYGAHQVSCSTTFAASTLTVSASDSGKLVAVNKSGSAQALTIAVTGPGGATSGTYTVWKTSGTASLGPITQAVGSTAFAGGTISYTIPAGTAASVDVTWSGGSGAVHPGTAAVAGTGTLAGTVTLTGIVPAAAALAGTGTLTGTASLPAYRATAALSGTGTLSGTTAPAGFAQANNAAGGTDGVTVTAGTAGNTGGASGTPFDVVVIGASATVTFSATQKAHGALSYKFTTGASGGPAYVMWTS